MQLLLTFYGDDFTGSTDALEALTAGGVPTVLFLNPPSLEDLRRFPDCRAAGVAGISRSQSPEWMDEHLPPVFEALRALGAAVCHYKVCSTFDSSPTHGNIGRAIEIGRRVFECDRVPMIVGAPVLRRYVLFGNLFATVAGRTYRIDRHPTMSRHPITPMNEGDLRLHLAKQTALTVSSVDVLALQSGHALEQYQAAGSDVILFDTLDDQTLLEAGKAVWEAQAKFVAGSSGVEYALTAWWHSLGILPSRPAVVDAGCVDRLLIVSGSCSPGTAAQIEWAGEHGFDCIGADPVRLVSDRSEYDRLLQAVSEVLSRGGSPVLYSARGPQDVVGGGIGFELGERLGTLAGELVRRSTVKRVVIAGGDTSGHAGRALRIGALTMIRPFAPGSPLCRVWSDDVEIDGLEIVLKGGQVGGPSLFGEVRNGRTG